MGRKKKIWPYVAGAVGLLGLGFLVFRKKTVDMMPSEAENKLPNPDIRVRPQPRGSDPQMRFEQYPSRPTPTSRGALPSTIAKVRAVIRKPKFIVFYDKKEWKPGQKIHGLFDVGEVLSYAAGSKLIARYGINMGSTDGIVASTPEEYIEYSVSLPDLGTEPPGLTKAGSGGVVEMYVPPGDYVLTPYQVPFQQESQKFYTGFWQMSTKGPIIPSSEWFVDRLAKGKCTKWWTKITMSNGGAAMRSAKTVRLLGGRVTNVTLQPYNVIWIRRKLKQDAESIAFNGFCETFGWIGDKLPDWVKGIMKKFAKWFA